MNDLGEIKEPLVREDFVNPIVGLSFLILFLLLVFISYNFKTYMRTILLSNISARNLNEKDVSESNRNKKAGIWLNIFFLMVLSLLVYNIVSLDSNYFYSESHLGYLLLSLITVVVLFTIKYIFKKIIGKVFQKEHLTVFCINRLCIKDKAYGVILFPLLVIYNFSLPLRGLSLNIILCLTCVYLLLRWLNGFLVGIKHGNIPYFYSFLYICTLEIIPVALVLKVISEPILSILA